MRIVPALVALLLFAGPEPAGAQGLFGVTPPRPGDLPVAPSKAGALARPAPSHAYDYFYLGSSKVRSAIATGPWPYAVSRVTYVYIAPAVGAAPQPLVIVPPTPPERDDKPNRERVPPPRPVPEKAAPSAEALDPGEPASVFRPIRPEDRARAGAPTEALPVPLPPRPEPLPLPGPPPPAAEPKMARAQQIESGKEAFRAQQYRRAEQCFLRAAQAVADDAVASFLLAQAQFAQGKYTEAVAAIADGLRRQPDWPGTHFPLRPLYGNRPDEFTTQVQRLAQALAREPEDAVLAFLLGYELWFDNRKDEARPLFERARTLAPDRRFIERFLQAQADSAIDHAVVELLPSGPRF